MSRLQGVRRGLVRALVLIALLLAVTACTGPARRVEHEPGIAAQEHRERALEAHDEWSLTGRLAVSDGRDGGSGRIEWRQQGERFTIDIRAPVSRRTWRLSGSPGRAALEGLDGGPRYGADAESLLRREVGWSVPFEDLKAWARGLRGTGRAEVDFDPAALPRQIRQRGWTVEYRGWNGAEPPLPTRVFATNGPRRVRLVVERWHDGPRG